MSREILLSLVMSRNVIEMYVEHFQLSTADISRCNKINYQKIISSASTQQLIYLLPQKHVHNNNLSYTQWGRANNWKQLYITWEIFNFRYNTIYLEIKDIQDTELFLFMNCFQEHI